MTTYKAEESQRMERLRQLIACLVVIVLVGCNGPLSTPVSTTPTTVPTDPAPTPTPTATPRPTPMITTLELWLPEELDPYSGTDGAEVLAQQLSEFSRAHPNLRVDVVVKKESGRGGLIDSMRTARDAVPSVLPDLVVVNASDLDTVSGSELIQPLDELLSQSDNDRFSFATSLGEVGGQTMGVVLGADLQHLAYRPALFESPPLTWSEVISAPASYLFPAGGYDGRVNDATLIQYLGAGGKLTDADEKPTLDEDVLVDVLDFYSRCVTHTVIAPTQVLTATHVDQVWEKFKEGEGGMSVVRASRYWREGDETMAAAPIPTKEGQPVSIARGWALAMVAVDPARQDIAAQFVEWLTAPDQSASWTQAAGYIPGTRTALRSWKVSEEQRKVLQDILESAVPSMDPALVEAVGVPMQQALVDVLRGNASPEEAAAAAVAALQE